jgi:hypothetical protein
MPSIKKYTWSCYSNEARPYLQCGLIVFVCEIPDLQSPISVAGEVHPWPAGAPGTPRDVAAVVAAS